MIRFTKIVKSKMYFGSWSKDYIGQRKDLAGIWANVVWVEDEWFVLSDDVSEKH